MKKNILIVLFSCFYSVSTYGFISGYDSNKCKPGTWTEYLGTSIKDAGSAREYANKNGLFYIFVIEAEGGCAYCLNAADKIWNTLKFKDWSKENDIPLVLGNYSKMTYAANEFLTKYQAGGMGAPVMAVVDGSDGETIFGYSTVRVSTAITGEGKTSPKLGGEGFLIESLNSEVPEKILRYYINKADDTPNEVLPSSSIPYYGTKASKITPAKEGKTPKQIGLWKGWEVNTLQSKAFMTSSGTLQVQSDDRQDWYSFSNGKAGQGYIVKCPTLSDKKGLGWFVVCTNSATAKKVCTAKNEKDIKKYAYFSSPMSTLKSSSGISFVAPKKGTVYLAFWRRPAEAKENITLDYTFTIQEGVIDAFYFGTNSETYYEYYGTNPVHVAAKLGDWVTNDCSFVVKRANSGTKAEVAVQFDAGSARRNTDYIIESDSKIVTAKFDSNEKSTLVPFKIISQKGLWKGDRSFTATITKSGKEGGITTITNTIREVDDKYDVNEPGSASQANAELPIGVSTNRLNADDTKDWFKLPAPDPTNFLRVAVTKLAASDENLTLKYGFYDGENWKTNDISSEDCFDVPPAWSTNDVYLKVERVPTDNVISCLYELKLETLSRPGVKFKDTTEYTTTFDSPVADTNVTFMLDIPGNWPYEPLPEIKAVDIGATNGLDYAFTDGVISTNGNVDFTLKNNNSAWRPQRSFTLTLEADENGFYYVPTSSSSVTVTLKADRSNPPTKQLIEESSTEPVGGTLESYDNRNVSNTNVSDTVYFYVTNGVDYVLAATDLLVKPIYAATNINVTVYTNWSFTSENVSTNLTIYPAITNWYSIITTTNLYCDADGSTVTNEVVSAETNEVYYSDLESTSNFWCTVTSWTSKKITTTTENDPSDPSIANTTISTNWVPHITTVTNSWTVGPAITNYFTVFETVTNIAARTQRNGYKWNTTNLPSCAVTNEFDAVSDDKVATNTSVTVSITNDCKWVEYGNWSLSDIANTELMPLLNFLETDDIKVVVGRDTNDTVLAEYSLGLSQWQTTTVQFAEAAWTNKQDEAELLYTLKRSGDTQFESTVYVSLECVTARDGVDVNEFEEMPVVFGVGETEAEISVTNLMCKTPNIWKGDRGFKLSLAVKDDKLTLGAVSNATVVLKSRIPEYEDGDSDSERSSNPVCTNILNDTWSDFKRTMNGEDVEDCFLFTDIEGGVRYRFSLELEDGTTNNLDNVMTTFYTNGCWDAAAAVHEDWGALLGKSWDFTPAEGVTNITVKLERVSKNAPASMGYQLKARKWPWPTFDFEVAEATIDDRDYNQVTVTVIRTNNTELTNKVQVVFTALANTVVSGYSPAEAQDLVFMPEQESTNVVVTVNPGKEGVWTGDWAFKATLKQFKGDESKLGTVTNMTVIVADWDGEFDARDELGDDSYEAVLTNQLAQSTMQSYAQTIGATLHGSDNCDWYCFTNVVSNALYYVAAEIGEKATNVVQRNFKVECYQYQNGTTNAVSLKNDMLVATSEDPILVKVWHDGANVPGVRSLPYELVYRKVDAYVYFGCSEKTVEETSPGFYLDVICVAGDNKLSAPVKATITSIALEDDTASSPEDFDGRALATEWKAGVTGTITNRVFIPLANYDTRWEGNETFHVTLAVDKGAGLGEITSVKVTLVETDAPTPGVVAITGAGDPLKKVTDSLTLSTRERGTVNVRLTRKGGTFSDVVTRWYWKDANNKTVKYVTNGVEYTYHDVTCFDEGVDGSVEESIPVPEVAGYQSSQKWTLYMKLAKDCTAAIAADSPKSIKFKVKDADYGGKISAYSADDLTRISFTGSKWYTGADGESVRSTHPSDGESVTMSATVTGPGTLVFDAYFENVTSGYLKVTGGVEELTLKGSVSSNRVEIAPGDRKLKFVFKRSKKDSPIAAVQISNVSFEPGETFNAYGTFTGPVELNGSVGLATLSVASSGKASGKLSVDKIWSFSNKNGWNTNDWTMAATAKCGSDSFDISITNDLAGSVAITNTSDNITAPTLMRNVWKDRPLSSAAAKLIESVQRSYDYANADATTACNLVVKADGSVVVSGTVNGTEARFSRMLWMINKNKGVVWLKDDIYLKFVVDGDNSILISEWDQLENE